MEASTRRRQALEDLDKASLVDIVLRLQDQLKAARETGVLGFEDGQKFEKAQRDAELASRTVDGLPKVGR